MFDFQTQLEVGEAGEAFLLKHCPHLSRPVKATREYDLVTTAGHSVEVKTDTYDMEKTPNFFMEYESHGKPGGPWRAAQDGVDIFVYMFVHPFPRAFWFNDTKSLVEALDEWKDKKRRYVHVVRNKAWVAKGYTVPREYLLDRLDVDVVDYNNNEELEDE